MSKSMNVYGLKESIMELIKDNDYDIEDLKKFLHPVTNYSQNQVFISNLDKIVTIFLEDRDGNNVFNVKDLEILGKDIIAITTLVSSLLLILGSLPDLKLKYDSGATEEIIFKLLCYIFLVIIPKETNNPWTVDEKKHVLELILAIYQVILSSQVTEDLIEKISKWFKKKGCCKCLYDTESNKEEVVTEHIPVLKSKLRSCILNNRDKIHMREEIDELKYQMRKFKKKKKVDDSE